MNKTVVLMALMQLDEAGRLQGRTNREIAEILGLSGVKGSVDSTISRYMRDYANYKKEALKVVASAIKADNKKINQAWK